MHLSSSVHQARSFDHTGCQCGPSETAADAHSAACIRSSNGASPSTAMASSTRRCNSPCTAPRAAANSSRCWVMPARPSWHVSCCTARTMKARHPLGLTGTGLLLAALAVSCGGISSKSEAAAGSPGGATASSGGWDPGTAGRADPGTAGRAAPGTAGAPPAQDDGTPPAEPCVAGGQCSVEGSQCPDDSGCCTMRDSCQGGRWVVLSYLGPCKSDTPAPPFECSSTPPVEGTAAEHASTSAGTTRVAPKADGTWFLNA